MLVPEVETINAKLSAEERGKASKWVSHQAQSIVRKATLILMVRKVGGSERESERDQRPETRAKLTQPGVW